ncbi:amino acid adenylation domain-containing protein [Micromonospora sp. NPDC049301]|uniref:non-ribosomal peptide synthetase n=1 Tax=Micromonospora sp. NPDC049301 TaxID=3155723 RepID=UPI003439DCCE
MTRAAGEAATTYPMTFEQESIWLNDQLHAGRSRYIESWVHRLRGPVDVRAIELALTGIVARHESLRSRLVLVGDEPCQIVEPAAPVRLDRRRVSSDSLSDAVRDAVTVPIDLAEPPLLKAALLELQPDDVVLAVAIHHAVVDGWSFSVLNHEFSELYRAAVDGTPPALVPVPTQLKEYARQQRIRAGSAEHERQLTYWRRQLADVPVDSTLPTDYIRPIVLERHGDRVDFRIDEKTGRQVAEMARHARSTPFVVVAAALQAMLYRHTDQRDLVIGTPISRRDRTELEPLIGCLTDILPLRQTVRPEMSFGDLVRQTRGVVWEAYANRDVPYGHLVRQFAKTTQVLERSPLFQVVMVLDDAPVTPLTLPAVRTERMYVHGEASKYDLFLSLIPAGLAFQGELEFSSDLFERSTVQWIAARFETLLDAATAAPETPLRDLPLLSPQERELVVSRRPPGRQGVRDLPLAHELFDRTLARLRDAPAVLWRDRTMTYEELDRAADRLATVLRHRGAAGRVVGICVERSFDLAISVLAVLKAGAAYVPLDPDYPVERLSFMIRDSGMDTLLVQHAVAAGIPVPDDVSVVVVDRPLPHYPKSASEVEASTADDLAYVIYTSGSTGTPKGVAMPHGPLANLVDWQVRHSQCRTGDRTLQFAAISFDVAFQEFFSTWASGGVLVMVDADVRPDPERLLNLIEQQGVTRLFLPFVALQKIAEHAVAQGRYPSTLREVITAGEQLHITPSLRSFFARLPQAYLENQYGPSETHVVTAWRLSGEPASWPELPPIGRPVDNASVYVLDERLRPQPLGTPGEICVGGPVLARGYLGRPDLTKEKFIDGVRLDDVRLDGAIYRTGDMGRFLPDGTIQYLGRNDGQVKIRGYRVEMGEVETAVKASPGIADAVVVLHHDDEGKRLVAYVRGQVDRVRAFVADRLPEYMIPSAIVPVSEFPLTPSGKVDRLALAQRAVNISAAVESRPARDGVELELCDIFSRILGVSHVGIDDNFFALGGNSFGSVRLVAEIRQRFAVDLSLRAIIQAPTVAALSLLIRRGGRDGGAGSLVRLHAHPEGIPLFCFHALPGTVVQFAALARHLGSQRSVYGLQSRGLAPDHDPHTDLHPMAQDYLAEMRSIQPTGPYALLGFSMGGVIAYEVARQLRASGERVELLALVDTDSHWDSTEIAEDALARLVRVGLRLDLDVDDLMRMSPERRVDELLHHGIAAGTLPLDYGAPALRRMLEIYETNTAALLAYTIEPYLGDIVLFRAMDSTDTRDDLGWRSYAPTVTVHQVPGHHYEVMESQNVPVIAKLLNDYLADSDTRERAGGGR